MSLALEPGMDDNTDNVFKIILIGASAVGKLSLQRSFERKAGTRNYDIISINFTAEKFQSDGKSVILNIWKLSGQEMFMDMYRPLIRNALGAVIIYDITNRQTFEIIHQFYNMFGKDVEIMLLGNKCDLTDCREVATEEGEKVASELGVKFMETSALRYINVEEAFTVLARDMINQQEYKHFEKLLLRPLVDSSGTIERTHEMITNILKYGVEKNYHIRVMVVGNENVGKSTLVRRLLKKTVDLKTYNSTNGIDIHIQSCDVDIETGVWNIHETHGVGLIEQFWTLFGGKVRNESLSLRELAKRNRNFHLRAAKVLQNKNTFQEVKSAGAPVSVKMTRNICSETDDTSTPRTTVHKHDSEIDGDLSEQLDETLLRPVHQSIDLTDLSDIHTAIRKANALNAEDKRQKARIDLYDFAGQSVFHASHPTFLSARAIYILTFDMNKIIHKRSDERGNVDELCTTDTALGHPTTSSSSVTDSILFWLNSVYMFAKSKSHTEPHVILVGTHADKLPKENRDKVIAMCFRSIRLSLADSPLKIVLSNKEYVVDNTVETDPSYAQIQAEVLRLAQLQQHWGEQTPSKWLQLDREIQCAKESGTKVLSVRQIKELNSRLELNLSDDRELEMFLQFLHDAGEILFFNEITLRNYIVLDPVWLVDAVKTIITADQFAFRSPKHAETWKRFCETGIIKHATIVAIFKENAEDTTLFENYKLVLRLLEKFLFIASPTNIAEDSEAAGGATAKTDPEESNSERKAIEYIVPSMVHEEIDTRLVTSAEGLSSSTVFCMVSKNNFLPPAVFHKLLAICISNWQIVEQNRRKQIFRGLCRFNLDHLRHYKLTVFAVGHAIHARIVSYVDDLKPPPDICRPVQEFLILSLRKILRSMGFSEEFRACIQCPQFSPVDHGGYLDIDLMENQVSVTCDDCDLSHVLRTVDVLRSWRDMSRDCSCDTEEEDGDSTNGISDHTNVAEGSEKCLDLPITQEHLNHARVCNALVTVCADGLRDILLSQIPPGYPDFYQLLKAKQGNLL